MSAACRNACGRGAFTGYPTCCRSCHGPDGPHDHDCARKTPQLARCCERCSRPAFKTFKTCCTHCKGSSGPHAHDCASKCQQTMSALGPPPPAAVPPAAAGGGYAPGMPVAGGGYAPGMPVAGGGGGGYAPGMPAGGGGAGGGYMPGYTPGMPVPGGGGAGYAPGHAPAAAGPCAPAAPAAATGGVLGICGNCGGRFPVAPPPGAGPGARIGVNCPTCGKPTEICITGPAPPSKGKPSGPGRKRALLVGVNYTGTRVALKGCVNDVRNIYRLLTETYRWPASSIRVLTDEEGDRSRMPTKQNIMANLRWLARGDDGPRPGDVMFFHFSGHGAQKEDPRGLEEDGMNETILPVDFQSAGMITDDELTEMAVTPLPEYAKLTVVMDCCHSGTGLDLPFLHTSRGWKMEPNPWYHPSDVQLFSGCEDHATSADVSSRYGHAGGAMTTALCDVLRKYPNPSYPQLMEQLTQVMKAKGFPQRPQLSSSQQFSFDRPFVVDDPGQNRNGTIGRVVNTKFKANPRPFAPGDPLGGLLQELGLSPPAAALAAAAVGIAQDLFRRMSR